MMKLTSLRFLFTCVVLIAKVNPINLPGIRENVNKEDLPRAQSDRPKDYPNLSDFKVYEDNGQGYTYNRNRKDDGEPVFNRNQQDTEDEEARLNEEEFSSQSKDVFGKGYATGLEFGKGVNPFPIDEEFFFKPEEPRDPRVYFRVVQMFIRNAKGLPLERKDEPYRLKTVNESVEWSFMPYHLSLLSKIEFRVYSALKLFSYRKEYRMSNPLPILESYLKDFERSSFRAYVHINASNAKKPEKEKEGPFFYIGTHPTLVHLMIRRFAQDLPEIISRLEDKKLIDKLNKYFEELGFLFPTQKDLDSSLASLLRLQQMSNMKTTDLALGRFEGIDTYIRLDALHALEIGAYYISSEVADLALHWLNYGMRLVEVSPFGRKYPAFVNMFEMSHGYAAEMNNVLLTILRGRMPFTYFTQNVTYPFIQSRYVRMWDVMAQRTRNLRMDLWKAGLDFGGYQTLHKNRRMEVQVVHAQLCTGNNYQTEEEKKILKCWHETKLNPYWYINPIKVELLHADPPIVMVHDFIGHILGEVLRSLAVDRLNRSSIYGGLNASDSHPHNKGLTGDSRTSYQAWLETSAKDDNVITQFSYRIQLLTGLNVVTPGSSEMYQVAVYGSSHHFAPHLDNPVEPGENLKSGARLTTVMGYLTETKVGGRTAFPFLGLSVSPVKGALLMWNNQMNDHYHQNHLTMHGGCPVTFGTKWIVNKWINDFGNTFSFKCGENSPKLFLTELERRFKSPSK